MEKRYLRWPPQCAHVIEGKVLASGSGLGRGEPLSIAIVALRSSMDMEEAGLRNP